MGADYVDDNQCYYEDEWGKGREKAMCVSIVSSPHVVSSV
jgi:hypothetical protein